MIRRLGGLLAALLLASGAQAATLELDGAFIQGGLVKGRAQAGTRLTLDGRPVRVAPDGRFVFGFGRDHGPAATLEARYPDGSRERRELTIQARQYRVQRIDGLPPRQVTPNAVDLKRIRAENARIAAVRAIDTPEALFASGWIWPSIGPISGVFGSQRILNGKPRRPHYGVDVAAPAGSPVVAPADGIVRLAEPDLFFTGATVMVDHGHGLTSVYSHLSAVDVAVGHRVRQGEPIGKVGRSGRATGAHLDWRVNWFTERLDPALLAGPMPDG